MEGVQDPLCRSFVPSISPVSIHLKLVLYFYNVNDLQCSRTLNILLCLWHWAVCFRRPFPYCLGRSSTEGFNRAYNQGKLCSMNPLKAPLTFSSCLNPSYVFPQHSDQAPCGLPGWAFFGMAGLPHVGYSLISRYARQLAGN